MNTTETDPMSAWPSPGRSPRIPDHTVAGYPAAARPPEPHTNAELARMLVMLRQAGADIISIGHGRDPASITAAQAMAAAWTATGGVVLAIVDWPATAASWLRPARRLTADDPDAWVIADTVAGCAQLVRRLAARAGWDPTRTVGFASLASPDLIALTAPTTLAGKTGATPTGGTWRVGHDRIIRTDEPDRAR